MPLALQLILTGDFCSFRDIDKSHFITECRVTPEERALTEEKMEQLATTNKVLPVAKEWQRRPLESVYAVVLLDAIHYHVRSEGQVVKKAVYIAIGIGLDGRKDVLGMWVGEDESAKYWAAIFNSLKDRWMEDILIACTDDLTGFSTAIEAAFRKQRYKTVSSTSSAIPPGMYPARI